MHNKKYAYEPKEKETSFVPIDNFNLEHILCTREERTILDGQAISYNGKYYKVITNEEELKPIYRGTKVIVYENVLNKNKYVKHYNKFYIIQLIQDRIGRSDKIKITKIENQKNLEQVLKERDERLKARANKVSS